MKVHYFFNCLHISKICIRKSNIDKEISDEDIIIKYYYLGQAGYKKKKNSNYDNSCKDIKTIIKCKPTLKVVNYNFYRVV